MRISDWSSDVCSSDLHGNPRPGARTIEEILREPGILAALGLCRKDRLRSPVAERVSGDGRTRWAEIINLQGRRSARSDGERPWRSDERRTGKECVSTFSSRWSPWH